MKEIMDQFREGRHEFENGRLDGIEVKDPYHLFEEWMKAAVEKQELEANAFTLSTVNEKGQPGSRIVYLKELLDGEFIFYTNYSSQKGQDIAVNHQVCALFFWPSMARQIRIEGICTKVPAEVSDAYFATRPRGSQIGAWASHQSEVLSGREELEARVNAYDTQFTDVVPRPPHWGGYALRPTGIEFWQGRPSRLHDRLYFTPTANGWNLVQLNP
jgi:pyridoxamine 5'-phosphate oxidase